ncbi:hypothetical protein DK26_23335 [Bosea sp. WAO]|uniref:hypothetical protein n=1 Tax=Bosea sp. WAO TaxID=406341 RepID=UPI00074798AC|nr:hypothetical protein [Bosea sp. WAO]KUL93456.1 hypothetical protein DK26_23335 [Bosea sp. WAO]
MSSSTTWAVGRDGRLIAIAAHEPEIEAAPAVVRAPLRDAEPAAPSISLPTISAFAEIAEAPPLRRAAPALAPICADKQARIAMIRASHRKLARAGIFDHCRYQP